MKHAWLLAPLIAVGALVGCKGPAEPQELPMRTGSQILAAGAAQGLWDELLDAVPIEGASETKYFSAPNAERCPKIEVVTAGDKEVEFEPGEPGRVTLVVFWSMDSSTGRAAMRHASDLAHTYRQWGVQAIGIVEKTASASGAESFGPQHGITCPFYYDDLSALEDMSDEVGAKQDTAVPSIFIVDRQMRLRFYRAGFRYMVGADATARPGQEVVKESTPTGECIEDYVQRILEEG